MSNRMQRCFYKILAKLEFVSICKTHFYWNKFGIGLGTLLLVASCRSFEKGNTSDAAVASATAITDAGGSNVVPSNGMIASAESENDGKPRLGIIAYVATVYNEPRDTAKKLGYLRVGTKVVRAAEPVGRTGCPEGWYEIEPRGFVCAGAEATTDLNHPILRAAVRVKPNLTNALPYDYAFVRAVLPMYLRIPNAEEQEKSEFKLKEHLDWFKENGPEVSKVILGANDVPLDARGVPVADKKLGELGSGKNSIEMSIGELLGGESDNDPIPFWLEGHQRLIPNISDFKVPEYAAFADRARRHTGLALISSFLGGEDSLNRRFAVTTDLRLVPATKIKPDTASAWHGIELNDALTLPIAFVRSKGARNYKIIQGKVTPSEEVQYREVVPLIGKMRTVGGIKYFRTSDKHWLHESDVSIATIPASWPEDAEQGKKWIEISIKNQTLVLWEGKKPVYATLVSSGQAGMGDPKKTTATVRGVFHIRNKHITATMDSNEGSSVGGKANTTAKTQSIADNDDSGNKGKKKTSKSKDEKSSEKKVPQKGDGEYGVTKRRGEGTFQLRDVPYIQYFESGYALHAAYWHDVFGTPRSHGCVNLSPVDAHRIFFWTDPPVPTGWHAINTGDEMGSGTAVIVHE